MAKVAFERLPDNASTAQIVQFVNSMAEGLEYILTNIDEENTTDAYDKAVRASEEE